MRSLHPAAASASAFTVPVPAATADNSLARFDAFTVPGLDELRRLCDADDAAANDYALTHERYCAALRAHDHGQLSDEDLDAAEADVDAADERLTALAHEFDRLGLDRGDADELLAQHETGCDDPDARPL